MGTDPKQVIATSDKSPTVKFLIENHKHLKMQCF